MSDTSPKLDPALSAVPGGLTRLGCALMGSGEGAKAVAILDALVAARPSDPELRSAVRTVLSHQLPDWHANMLADKARNAGFARAIARVVRPGDRVLDIGAGSGLLGMMAARAKAASVVACEAHPAVAATARAIVAANGLADRVAVIAGHSTTLDRARDLDGGADVIIAEVFGEDLIGEGALPTLQHAVAQLSRPGVRVLPAAGSIRIALAHRDLAPPALRDVEGYDLGLFERHVPPVHKLAVGDKALSLRGAAHDLFAFRFDEPHRAFNGRAALTLTAAADGPANGAVQWLRLQLDDAEAYENRPGPGSRSHWRALFHPFADGRVLAEGETVRLHAAHDGERVQLWFDAP